MQQSTSSKASRASEKLDRLLVLSRLRSASDELKAVAGRIRESFDKRSLSDWRNGVGYPMAPSASRLDEITEPLAEDGLHVRGDEWHLPPSRASEPPPAAEEATP